MRKLNIYMKLIIGILTIIGIPLILDYFIFGNKIESNLNNAEWGSFLGGYLGAIISVLGVFISIKYQIFENSNSKIKGTLKTIKAILNLNFEILEENQCALSVVANLSYTQGIVKINECEAKLLYDFPRNFFEENINEIIEENIQKEMYEIISGINNINLNYNLQMNCLSERNRIIKEKLKNEKDGCHSEIVKIIEKLNEIIVHYIDVYLEKIDESKMKYTQLLIIKNIEKIEELFINYNRKEINNFKIVVDLSEIIQLKNEDIIIMSAEGIIGRGLKLGNIYLELIENLFFIGNFIENKTLENEFFIHYLRGRESLEEIISIKEKINILIKKECFEKL